MFQTKVVGKKTYFTVNNVLYNRAVREIEKYCRAGKATDYNMVDRHCMLDT
jgi:hypothetical protein